MTVRLYSFSPTLAIDALMIYYQLYPSHKTRDDLKLTACEAWLVDVIGPMYTSIHTNITTIEEISDYMTKMLPTRIMMILAILRVVERAMYFVIDEEQELLKDMRTGHDKRNTMEAQKEEQK